MLKKPVMERWYTKRKGEKIMTGQELIDWIKENNAEKMQVVVQYRDSGGMYPGLDEEISPEVNESCGREVIVLWRNSQG